MTLLCWNKNLVYRRWRCWLFGNKVCVSTLLLLLQQKAGNREPERKTWRAKTRRRHIEEIWVRQRKTRRAQCKPERVNMYRPNLIIPHPPGPVIRCLIKAGDKRQEVEDGEVGGKGRRYGLLLKMDWVSWRGEINRDREIACIRRLHVQSRLYTVFCMRGAVRHSLT